uniref:Uncharacterized protein n=1 Tax=Anguilla anguilla TaxID=7936 RepID=A0A0E9PYG7_ANGAN
MSKDLRCLISSSLSKRRLRGNLTEGF